jgi:hypothetical protein
MKLLSFLAVWATLLSAPAWAAGPGASATAEPDEVGFQALPRPAQEALLAFHRQAASEPYACYGASEKQFEQAVGPLVQTDYNGDGRPDYLFTSPCRAPDPKDGRLPPGAILLSGPAGYTVSQRFSAALGRVGRQRALLVDAPCDAAERDYDGPCYLGRIWDPERRAWSDVVPVRLGPDGGLRAAPRPAPLTPAPKAAGIAEAPLPPPRPRPAPAPSRAPPAKTTRVAPEPPAAVTAPKPAATAAPKPQTTKSPSEAQASPASAPATPAKPPLPAPSPKPASPPTKGPSEAAKPAAAPSPSRSKTETTAAPDHDASGAASQAQAGKK